MEDIKRGDRFRTRMYRNRRLGEFLKELHLSEGRSTGVPTIQEKLEENGSPRATFETDEDRRATRVEIPIHPDFLSNIIENNVNSAQKNERSLIEVLSEVLDTKTLKRLTEIILYLNENDGITPQTAKRLVNKSEATVRRYLKELVDVGLLIQSGSTNNIIYEKLDLKK